MIRKILQEAWFLSPYAVILLLICFIDLTLTALGIYLRILEEGNPLLYYFLSVYGLSGFILVKVFFIVVPISILEVMPKINLISKRKVVLYYWILIPSYVLILVAGTVFKIFRPL